MHEEAEKIRGRKRKQKRQVENKVEVMVLDEGRNNTGET